MLNCHIGKHTIHWVEQIQLVCLVKSNLAAFQANNQEGMGKGGRENY